MTEKDIEIIKKFVKFCAKKLKIKTVPKIILTSKKDDVKTTGGYRRGEKPEIIAYTKGRHRVDICRSVGHEMEHHKQREDERFDDTEQIQDVGGELEDDANAVAGRLIKQFAYAGNMNIYENKQIITEGRLETAKRQFPGVKEDLIDYISANDPSENNKYLTWIIRQLRKEELITPNKDPKEIVEQILASVKQYEELLPYYLSKNLNYDTVDEQIRRNPKDINSFTSLEELDKVNGILLPLHQQQKLDDDKIKGVEQIYSGPTFLIVHPRNNKSICYYGSDTRFCRPSDNSGVEAMKHIGTDYLVFVINRNIKGPNSIYNKIAVLVPKNPLLPFKYILSNDSEVNLDTITTEYDEINEAVKIINFWAETKHKYTTGEFATRYPQKYVLSKYTKDEILGHYKGLENFPMTKIAYNNGVQSELYYVGDLHQVVAAARETYKAQITTNPKLIYRYSTLLPSVMQYDKLKERVYDVMGFNDIYIDSNELRKKIRDYYPVPPIKLKTAKIDENNDSLHRLKIIDNELAEIKEKITNIKHFSNKVQREADKINKGLAINKEKLETLQIRSKQIKPDSEKYGEVMNRISYFENLISIDQKNVGFKETTVMEYKTTIINFEEQIKKLSEEYTTIVSTLENDHKDKINYEYSKDQIKQAKDKIARNIMSDPMKWIKYIKIKPDELIDYIYIDDMVTLIAEEFKVNIKSFWNYKFLNKIDNNGIDYYIFKDAD